MASVREGRIVKGKKKSKKLRKAFDKLAAKLVKLGATLALLERKVRND